MSKLFPFLFEEISSRNSTSYFVCISVNIFYINVRSRVFYINPFSFNNIFLKYILIINKIDL